jgi:hypothetical protein
MKEFRIFYFMTNLKLTKTGTLEVLVGVDTGVGFCWKTKMPAEPLQGVISAVAIAPVVSNAWLVRVAPEAARGVVTLQARVCSTLMATGSVCTRPGITWATFSRQLTKLVDCREPEAAASVIAFMELATCPASVFN